MTALTMLIVFHPPHSLLWSSCSNNRRHSRGQCCSQFELEERAMASPWGPPCEEEGGSLPLLFPGCCKMGPLPASLWNARTVAKQTDDKAAVGMAHFLNVIDADMQPLWSGPVNREAFYKDTGINCDDTALVSCLIFLSLYGWLIVTLFLSDFQRWRWSAAMNLTKPCPENTWIENICIILLKVPAHKQGATFLPVVNQGLLKTDY